MGKCIAEKGSGLSVEAMQAAVWMYTDKITYSHMNEKFPIDRADWDAADRVYRSCQAGR
jgi:hypothetical protein